MRTHALTLPAETNLNVLSFTVMLQSIFKSAFALFLVCCLAPSFFLQAQSFDGPMPEALAELMPEVLTVGSIDVAALELQAAQIAKDSGRELVGTVVDYSIDFFAAAGNVPSFDASGAQIFSAAFKVDGARALAVHFDDFHLPQGVELWCTSGADLDENLETPWVEGPYDQRENNDHARFATGDAHGSVATLWLRIPAGTLGTTRLHIEGFNATFNRGGSELCEVDVACPEIAGWECQRDGVVRLSIIQGGGSYLCSGSMVNTTSLDCRQYLLTALHCADEVTEDEFPLLKVYFNYERSGCGTGNGLLSHKRTGVIRLADSDDVSPQGFNGSDFLLLEVEDDIPTTWPVFFNGWNAVNQSSDWGTGIHHPSGDVKKISTYSSNLTSSSIGGFGTHWSVTWVETETNHGVTEGGSSGSPIFNEAGLLVGTLSAGLSACSNGSAGNGTGPNQPDYYGKMSYHWDGNNPNPADEKLNLWLDAEGTGLEVLGGAYPNLEIDQPCTPSSSCTPMGLSEEQVASGLRLMPNPATDQLFIRLPGAAAYTSGTTVRVFDPAGRLIAEHSMPAGLLRLSTADWSRGIHLVSLQLSDGSSVTRRVILN